MPYRLTRPESENATVIECLYAGRLGRRLAAGSRAAELVALGRLQHGLGAPFHDRQDDQEEDDHHDLEAEHQPVDVDRRDPADLVALDHERPCRATADAVAGAIAGRGSPALDSGLVIGGGLGALTSARAAPHPPGRADGHAVLLVRLAEDALGADRLAGAA